MNLEEYLEKNCVLTGSRAMGFERNTSDYDYAVTQKQVNDLVELRLLEPEYTKNTNTGYNNRLRNDYSFKFYNNGKEYNFIVYPTLECLEVIKNITKCVSCIPEAEHKDIRNIVFEFLCDLLITDKVRGIPEINLDEDLPF